MGVATGTGCLRPRLTQRAPKLPGKRPRHQPSRSCFSALWASILWFGGREQDDREVAHPLQLSGPYGGCILAGICHKTLSGRALRDSQTEFCHCHPRKKLARFD